MVLLEFLYNINSDQQLCEEIGYNLAYRWFCKLSLTDKVPDHSSITRIWDRLGEKTYETLFNKVVDQCRSKGFVKLDQVMMDGSVIKAKSLAYKTHHVIDASSRVIIDCHVTTGSRNEVGVENGRSFCRR